MIVPLVLAAGASTRMGRCKAGLPFGEETALGLILGTCRRVGLAPVVVAGADEAAVREAAGPHPTARLVINRRWAEGRTTSIQAGLAALEADAEAFLIWPVDVCLPGPALVSRLLEARRIHPDHRGWVPSHRSRRGHPILLDARVAPRLAALAPDQPAREVTRALAAEGALHHLETDDPSVLMVMNHPEEHERWRRVYESR